MVQVRLYRIRAGWKVAHLFLRKGRRILLSRLLLQPILLRLLIQQQKLRIQNKLLLQLLPLMLGLELIQMMGPVRKSLLFLRNLI